jgi:hypothetical protein
MLARRRPNSGAISHIPGDVDLVAMLGECKERGTVNARGEKTFSVTKTMLKKIAAEAAISKKIPVLTFRFKDDEQVYAIFQWEDILTLFWELQELRRTKET